MSDLIQNAMTTNYLFQAFSTTTLLNRNITQNGISPNTPIVVSCRNTDYNDFVSNGYKYLFIFDMPLSDFIENSNDSVKRANIINHDNISINYFTSLICDDKSILNFGKILSDPLLTSKKPIQNHLNGPSLGQYTNSVISAFKLIVSQCPHNMEEVDYFQQRYYLATYNFLAIGTNQFSEKTSIIMVMKYKHTATNTDRVVMCGGGLQQIVTSSTTITFGSGGAGSGGAGSGGAGSGVPTTEPV